MGWLRRGGVQMMNSQQSGPLLGEDQSVTGKMLLQQGQNSLGVWPAAPPGADAAAVSCSFGGGNAAAAAAAPAKTAADAIYNPRRC